MDRRCRTGLAVVAVASLIGCQAGEITPAERGDAHDTAVGSGFGGSHVMPMTRPNVSGEVSQALAAPAGAHLTYYGGPILQKVQVQPIYWNSSVQFQSNLNSFYAAVVNSAYYDMLAQYSTTSPAQTLGRGTGANGFVDTQTSTKVTDAQVQTELAKLIDAGKVPNSADSYYPFHFPAGTTVTDSSGTASCTQWCAYHGTFVHNGKNVYYGIIPDQGGSCAGGCGSNAQMVNNLTSVSSHELVEATTDPAVGLATTVGPPLAWYDSTNGEIGDICNAQQGTAAGFVVQTEWSNKDGACVDHSGTCTPNCSGRVCGSDGCGGSCGTCPSGQSCNSSGQCQSTCTPSCSGKTCGPDGCGGTCGTCPTGQTCGTNGTCTTTCTPNCSGKTCGSDGCGGTCGTCPSGETCGSNGTCQGGTTCAHGKCSTGAKLASGCDACVTKICASDPYCCSTMWDSICVGEVGSICGQSCGGGTCAHAICSTGSKLTSGCDPCVTKICGRDPYCCSTMWDSICVGEVKSICGTTCN